MSEIACSLSFFCFAKVTCFSLCFVLKFNFVLRSRRGKQMRTFPVKRKDGYRTFQGECVCVRGGVGGWLGAGTLVFQN